MNGGMRFDYFLNVSGSPMHAATCLCRCMGFMFLALLLGSMPLQASEQRMEIRTQQILESILKSAPTGIGVVENRVIVQVNDYILDLTGYQREELIGESARIFYPTQEDYDYVGEEKYRQISEKGTGSVETRWQCKDGSIRHIILSSTALDPDDLSAGVVFTVTDITDRIQAEKELRESEERFFKIFNSSPAPLVVSEIATGQFIDVNERWVEMLGYTREEQIGRTSKDIGIWQNPTDRDQIVAKLEEKRYFKNEPIRFKTKAGEERFALWSGEIVNLGGREVLLSLILDETDRRHAEAALDARTRWFVAGLAVFILVLLIMITRLVAILHQRRITLDALQRSEENLATTLHSIGDGVIATDELGLIVNMNPVAEKLCGWSFADAKGKSLSEVFQIVNAISREPVENPVLKVLETGEVVGMSNHAMLLSKDGREYQISDSAAPIRNRSGVITGVVLVFSDVTEKYLAERALKESEVTYREIFNGMKDTIWIHEMDSGRFVDVNSRVTEMFGYSVQEALDLTVQDISSGIPPFTQQTAMQHFEKACRIGTQVFEWHCKHKDGSLFWTEVTLQRATINGVERIIAIERDINDRKRAEAEREEAIAMLETAINQSPSGILIANAPDVTIRWANSAALDIRGKSELPLSGIEVSRHSSHWQTFRADGSPYPSEELPLSRAILKGEITRNEEVIIRHASGEERWVSANAAPVRDHDGVITAGIVVFHDISDRKHAEARLQEFKTAVEQSIDGIAIVDMSGNIRFVNESWASMHNYAVDELRDKHLSVFHSPEQMESDVHPFIQKLMETGSITGEVGHIRKTGEVFPAWMTGTVLKGADGQPFGMFALMRDITEQKRAEEERERLQKQLQQASKMESVGRLAGGVAHDFNNMLSAILGYAELLLNRIGMDSPLRADLEEIQKAAERSADLTRQLLAFARKQTVAPRVLDLNETVGGMLKMLQRLIGEDIDLVWHPGTGNHCVKVDPSQIHQILANLCVNARDAINGVGQVTIKTDCIRFDDKYCLHHPGFIPGKYVMMSISDTGCGMSKEILQHLFEPFFTTKTIGKGTGLGLATVYGIVKQNDGFINVYSEPGHGTIFKIYLPLYQSGEEQMKQDGLKEPTRHGSETILLVEDEPSILKMTKTMLEHLGYNVMTASRPSEAIQMADVYSGVIHLLLTDVVMPEMNGRELASKILFIYPNLRCLFMSGYSADVIAHHGVLNPGVHFIQKPFSMKDLSARVREALETEQ